MMMCILAWVNSTILLAKIEGFAKGPVGIVDIYTVLVINFLFALSGLLVLAIRHIVHTIEESSNFADEDFSGLCCRFLYASGGVEEQVERLPSLVCCHHDAPSCKTRTHPFPIT